MRTIKSASSRSLKFQAAFLAAFFILGAEATTYHVSKAELAEGVVRDGTEAAPFATVADAITAASDGDEVVVGAGVYEITSPLIVKKRITVRGATGDFKDVEIKNIKKDMGSDSYIFQVLQLQKEGARVEAMTLSDGWLGNKTKSADLKPGSGMPSHIVKQTDVFGSVVNMTDGVISNCVIQGGMGHAGKSGSTYIEDKAYSVGVYMEGSDKSKSRLENCIIRNNYNTEGDEKHWGGGVSVPAGFFATISGCMISNNITRATGGGIAVGCQETAAPNTDPAKVDILNCVITDNYAGFRVNVFNGDLSEWTEEWKRKGGTDSGSQGYAGGAGAVFGGTLRNCLVFNNHSREGRGEKDAASKKIRTVGGSVARAVLYGCTIVSNVYERISGDLVNDQQSPKRNLIDYPGLYDCTAYNTISYNNCKRIWKSANEGDYTETVNATNNNYAESGADYYKVNNTFVSPACALYVCCTYPSTAIGTVDNGGNVWEDPLLVVTNAPSGFAYSGFSATFAPENENLLNSGLRAQTIDGERDLFGADRRLNGRPDIGCIETLGEDVSLIVVLDPESSRPTHDSLDASVQIVSIGDEAVTLRLQVAPKGVDFTDEHAVATATVTTTGTVTLLATGLARGTEYHARVTYREASWSAETEDSQTGEYAFATYARPFLLDPVIMVESGRVTITLTELFAASVNVAFKVDDAVIEPKTVTETGDIVCESAAIRETSSVTVTVSVPDGTEDDCETREKGSVLFVSPTGDDTNQGYMRAWPKATIQGAFAALTPGIDTIVVQAGTYVQTRNDNQIVLNSAVLLCGEDGLNGEKVEIRDRISFEVNSSNVATYHSVIEIAHPDAVVSNVVINGSDCVTDGFGSRRGVLLRQGRLENSTVTTIRTGHGSLDGAGVKMEGGEMIDCVITNCNHKNSLYGSKTSFFYPNGGGLYITNGLVDRCRIVDNRALNNKSGCGVYMTGGTLRNTLVSGNTGGDTGSGTGTGLYQTGGLVENCTIAGNTVSASKPAVYAGANATIVNSIIFGNTFTEGESANDLVAVEGADISYTCTSIEMPGKKNICADPLFADAENGNYSLTKDSPCVDKGNSNWFTGALDLDGNARVRGNRVDLGCYESEFKRAAGLLILVIVMDRIKSVLYNMCHENETENCKQCSGAAGEKAERHTPQGLCRVRGGDDEICRITEIPCP